MTLLERTLAHLDALVGFDTRNPPRAIEPAGGIFGYLVEALGPSFDHEVVDLGEGQIALYSRRGAPDRLYNFHVDTVPAADGYSRDPLRLHVEGGRAYGLGACDIKGASACMLAALEGSSADAALLFTSDEEFGRSRCIRAFLHTPRPFREVLVAEPTRAEAVLEHRGITTATAHFTGISGHASSGRADAESALHHAVDWAHATLEWARRRADDAVGPLRGVALNLGRIEGGVKPNMIAADTTVRFGFRPLPGTDGLAMLDELWQGIDPRHSLEPGFVAPSLPAPGHAPAQDLARSLGVPVAEAVNFWTEASLFSEAGLPTVVFGPGDIAQAHTADEWVALDQLQTVATAYHRWLVS